MGRQRLYICCERQRDIVCWGLVFNMLMYSLANSVRVLGKKSSSMIIAKLDFSSSTRWISTHVDVVVPWAGFLLPEHPLHGQSGIVTARAGSSLPELVFNCQSVLFTAWASFRVPKTTLFCKSKVCAAREGLPLPDQGLHFQKEVFTGRMISPLPKQFRNTSVDSQLPRGVLRRQSQVFTSRVGSRHPQLLPEQFVHCRSELSTARGIYPLPEWSLTVIVGLSLSEQSLDFQCDLFTASDLSPFSSRAIFSAKAISQIAGWDSHYQN